MRQVWMPVVLGLAGCVSQVADNERFSCTHHDECQAGWHCSDLECTPGSPPPDQGPGGAGGMGGQPADEGIDASVTRDLGLDLSMTDLGDGCVPQDDRDRDGNGQADDCQIACIVDDRCALHLTLNTCEGNCGGRVRLSKTYLGACIEGYCRFEEEAVEDDYHCQPHERCEIFPDGADCVFQPHCQEQSQACLGQPEGDPCSLPTQEGCVVDGGCPGILLETFAFGTCDNRQFCLLEGVAEVERFDCPADQICRNTGEGSFCDGGRGNCNSCVTADDVGVEDAGCAAPKQARCVDRNCRPWACMDRACNSRAARRPYTPTPADWTIEAEINDGDVQWARLGGRVDLAGAHSACGALNANDLNWRVPTASELARVLKAIDGLDDGPYYSRTIVDVNLALAINRFDGTLFPIDTRAALNVLCLGEQREDLSWSFSNFQESLEAGHDEQSNIVWNTDPPPELSFDAARTFCEGSGGLPNLAMVLTAVTWSAGREPGQATLLFDWNGDGFFRDERPIWLSDPTLPDVAMQFDPATLSTWIVPRINAGRTVCAFPLGDE